MSSFIFLHKYFHYFIITPYDVQVAVHCTCDNIGDTRDMKNKMKQRTYLMRLNTARRSEKIDLTEKIPPEIRGEKIGDQN